jgi:hypothetical protein
MNAVKDAEEFNTPPKFRPFSQEPCLASALLFLLSSPKGICCCFVAAFAVAFWLSSFAEGGGSAGAVVLVLAFCHPSAA